jgi:hypothetical protein
MMSLSLSLLMYSVATWEDLVLFADLAWNIIPGHFTLETKGNLGVYDGLSTLLIILIYKPPVDDITRPLGENVNAVKYQRRFFL